MRSNIPRRIPGRFQGDPIKVEIVTRATWRDRAISYGAACIAIASFLLSLWQGWAGREHDLLSFRPIISIGENLTGQDPFGLLISNDGAGVALVDNAYIYLDGKLVGKMTPDWWAKIKAAAGITQPVPVYYEWFTQGSLIETGASKTLLVWRQDSQYDPTGASKKLFEQFVKERLGVEIAYHSLYDEKWRISYVHGVPVIDRKKAGTPTLDP